MNNLETDDIIRRIRSDDQQIVSELTLIIEKIARKWNWTDSVDLDDIAQDCFLKLLQNLEAGKFKGNASLSTYIYSITRNTCIDYYRADQAVEMTKLENLELLDNSPLPDSQVISMEERKTAYRVILAMPEECRRLWRMIFYGKRTYKQAGETLKVTEGTVKRKMWECRQIAREKVKCYEI